MKNIIPYIILLLFAANAVVAQDVHWSQYYLQASLLNPALVGVAEADYNAALSYRKQWQSVPVPYLSVLGTYGQRWKPILENKATLGIGAYFLYDKAGESRLQWTQVGVMTSVIVPLNEQSKLSIGVMPSFANRRFDASGLSFDSQFDGFTYQASADNNENFENYNQSFLNLSMGANWHYAYKKRNSIDFGGAIHNILTPTYHYTNGKDAQLALRAHAFANAVIKVNEKLDAHVAFQVANQAIYQEYITTIAARWYIKNVIGQNIWIEPALGLRLGDAYIPTIAFKYNQWLFSMSYDVNFSPLIAATNKQGGAELVLVYEFTKVHSTKCYFCKPY